MSTRRALLLIADIGGYTEYMQFHRSVLGHAEAATARLLGRVVDAAHGFDLVEVEGDAAFLSRDAERLDGPAAWSAATGAAVALHRAFHQERRYVERNMCPCGSCTRTADLRLKFVAHLGEVATQTIRRWTKLVGLDVIHVHRLLKNPVRVPEYLLPSDDLYRAAGPAAAAVRTAPVDLDLEGIGSARAHVVDLQDLPAGAPLVDPSWRHRLGSTVAMVGRGLPHVGPRRRDRVPEPVA
ncbi:DUF2652 domain-containing protein [Cellulomonas endophytica]|uniref:DUF2652 domain-containing protein n=1 Tax=Cellulomonas endophytica TaxID=2494735 RepID=UPI001011C0E2|nr:DUF2652 domain-containing protein [Cellulomonas endophytica]